jgi:hypothetical protein
MLPFFSGLTFLFVLKIEKKLGNIDEDGIIFLFYFCLFQYLLLLLQINKEYIVWQYRKE